MFQFAYLKLTFLFQHADIRHGAKSGQAMDSPRDWQDETHPSAVHGPADDQTTADTTERWHGTL